MLEVNYLSFLFDSHQIIKYGGVLLIFAIIYIETGFFLGFILPGGDYLLFASGIFCGTHFLDIPLFLLVFTLIIASFLGDLTGYLKGKWLGDKLFYSNKSKFFKIEYLNKGKSFYTRYGLWAFILGRFMPIIRTLTPMIAGASGFTFHKFLLFNAIGAIVWVSTLVPLGYYVGKIYPDVIQYSFYILFIFVLIASLPMIKILFSKNK